MDVFHQMETEMQRIADEAIRGFFSDIPAPHRYWQPRVDVHETADHLAVKVELGGVRADHLQVSLSPDARVLTIAGTRDEDAAERADRIRCYQLEIYFGPFERHIVLPQEVRVDRDGITASYREGFLVVLLPKKASTSPEVRSVPVTEG